MWLELDHVILLMVYNVHVSNVELAWVKFTHQFCPIKAVRVVDPSALLVEDRWLQRVIREVSLGHCWVTMLIVFLPRQESVLHISVVYEWACIWGAVWECIFRICAKVAVLATIVLVTFAFDLIDVAVLIIRPRLSMRVANCFAHMLLIKYTFNISILNFISLLESLLTLLTVIACVRISTDAWSIVSDTRKSMWIAFLICFLLMFI